jgi:hypothetical protein
MQYPQLQPLSPLLLLLLLLLFLLLLLLQAKQAAASGRPDGCRCGVKRRMSCAVTLRMSEGELAFCVCVNFRAFRSCFCNLE